MAQLTDHEKAVYEWQIWVPGFGESGQEALKDASVLVSRVGGLGSVVAYELAAAGVGSFSLAYTWTDHSILSTLYFSSLLSTEPIPWILVQSSTLHVFRSVIRIVFRHGHRCGST